MKSFEYAAPAKVKDATALLGQRWGETEILAGGTDLVTCLKQGLTSPKRVVSLRNIKELQGVRSRRQGITIGAMVPLGDLAADTDVQEKFPSLITAIRSVSSPQLLAAGTVGGDLCQRPRCWYFRNGFGLLATDGKVSRVREGENRYHAVFGTDGPALFVSPSSLGPALVALGAVLTVAGPGGKTREIPAAAFFRSPQSETERETALQPNEILVEIFIPAEGKRNATYEVRHRHGLDWPYVTASVAFHSKGGVASGAQVVLGHVAPTPWIAAAAARLLEGGQPGEELAERCGQAAIEGAKPLSGNAYKLTLIKTAVKRAVLAAGAA